MKLNILAIGAHPDDVELGAGGTLAKHIASGDKVGILDLTQGEMGTRGSAEIRKNESEKAKHILKLSVRDNAGFADGWIQNNKPHKIALIEKIRLYQPDIVLANALDDRHPDHGTSAKLVKESCFLAGLDKIKTTYKGEPQQAWRPQQVYHYIQFYSTAPHFVVNITGYMDTKEAAIKAYSSQFYNPKSREPQTLIAQKNFLDSVRYRAANFGLTIGADYGEGFTTHRYIGVEKLTDLL